MGCSWHLHWAFSATLFFAALGACAEIYSQSSDVQRGVGEQAIRQDLREEDAGFDDYNYRGDYELRDRWWIEPEIRRPDQVDATERAAAHAQVNRRDFIGRGYNGTTWDEAADIVEPRSRISVRIPAGRPSLGHRSDRRSGWPASADGTNGAPPQYDGNDRSRSAR